MKDTPATIISLSLAVSIVASFSIYLLHLRQQAQPKSLPLKTAELGLRPNWQVEITPDQKRTMVLFWDAESELPVDGKEVFQLHGRWLRVPASFNSDRDKQFQIKGTAYQVVSNQIVRVK